MKKSLLCIIAFVLSVTLYSQENKSPLSKATEKVTDKFPPARMIDVEYQQTFPSDFESKLLKKEYKEGEIKRRDNIQITVNVPVIKKQRWAIKTSVLYRYNYFDHGNIVYKGDPDLDIFGNNSDLHYIAGITSFSYTSKLFGKPAIYNVSLGVDGSHKDVEAFKAASAGILVLKADRRTTITAGLAVNYDPASLSPVIPIFTLEHKIRPDFILDVAIPQRIMVKKGIGKNSRLSLGSELKSNIFYIYPEKEAYSKSYYHREIQLKSGFTYEYRMNSFIIYGKTGLVNTIDSKVYKTGETGNKYIYSSKNDPGFYFSAGVSFNP